MNENIVTFSKGTHRKMHHEWTLLLHSEKAIQYSEAFYIVFRK